MEARDLLVLKLREGDNLRRLVDLLFAPPDELSTQVKTWISELSTDLGLLDSQADEKKQFVAEALLALEDIANETPTVPEPDPVASSEVP